MIAVVVWQSDAVRRTARVARTIGALDRCLGWPMVPPVWMTPVIRAAYVRGYRAGTPTR